MLLNLRLRTSVHDAETERQADARRQMPPADPSNRVQHGAFDSSPAPRPSRRPLLHQIRPTNVGCSIVRQVPVVQLKTKTAVHDEVDNAADLIPAVRAPTTTTIQAGTPPPEEVQHSSRSDPVIALHVAPLHPSRAAVIR